MRAPSVLSSTTSTRRWRGGGPAPRRAPRGRRGPGRPDARRPGATWPGCGPRRYCRRRRAPAAGGGGGPPRGEPRGAVVGQVDLMPEDLEQLGQDAGPVDIVADDEHPPRGGGAGPGERVRQGGAPGPGARGAAEAPRRRGGVAGLGERVRQVGARGRVLRRPDGQADDELAA